MQYPTQRHCKPKLIALKGLNLSYSILMAETMENVNDEIEISFVVHFTQTIISNNRMSIRKRFANAHKLIFNNLFMDFTGY